MLSSTSSELLEAQVFAELVYFVKTGIEEGLYIYKLSQQHSLFEERLGVFQSAKTINRTRLKTKLLTHFFLECQEQNDGKNVIVVFHEGMLRLLKEAMKSRDLDQEAISLSRVCNSIREKMFNTDFFQFSGSFATGCEESSVPVSLKSLVSSLIYGPNINDQNVINSRACLSICQLILFNSKESVSRANTSRRHSRVR